MDSGGYYKKRGGYYKNYYNKYNNNNRNYRPQQRDVFVKRIDKVTKSDENGFTGNPSTWFSDEEFFKKMQGTSDYEHKKDYYLHSKQKEIEDLKKAAWYINDKIKQLES